MAHSVDPDQTAPIGAVCSGSALFASILNSSVMLGNYLLHTTSADDIFKCIFFLGALRIDPEAESFKRMLFMESCAVIQLMVSPSVSLSFYEFAKIVVTCF